MMDIVEKLRAEHAAQFEPFIRSNYLEAAGTIESLRQQCKELRQQLTECQGELAWKTECATNLDELRVKYLHELEATKLGAERYLTALKKVMWWAEREKLPFGLVESTRAAMGKEPT